MSKRTLYLAWQDAGHSKEWFPVGRLDADVQLPSYRFRYIGGAKRAKDKVGFPELIEFPELEGDYTSSELFPLFQNRVMNRSRPDFDDYLYGLDLTGRADAVKTLSVNGGARATDAYEVFPKVVKDRNGGFTCRFLLHGQRHVNPAARRRIRDLQADEELYATLEFTNPATRLAVQMQTTDYHMIGWAPRYLVHDLARAMAKDLGEYRVRVVLTTTRYTSAKPSVLIEMTAPWPSHKPMSGLDFRPLAGSSETDADAEPAPGLT